VNERSETFNLNKEQIQQIMTIGTSAGGARPKAILSKNFTTNEYAYSYEHKEGFTPVIIKFDMIDPDRGTALDYGRIEFCYHKMAIKCKIEMTNCGVFYTDERSHFYTHRFERNSAGEKIHSQTFAGISGLNPRELHPYETIFDTMLQMNLSYYDLEQQFRRMVFNYYSANDDCHIKNISFLMDKDGKWTLSPGYDITFPYNVNNIFKKTQPLSINGKVKNITSEDFLTISNKYGIKSAEKIMGEIKDAVLSFEEIAIKMKLNNGVIKNISSCFRLPES
jgi:serine/threonine-protein kinase HipA